MSFLKSHMNMTNWLQVLHHKSIAYNTVSEKQPFASCSAAKQPKPPKYSKSRELRIIQ